MTSPPTGGTAVVRLDFRIERAYLVPARLAGVTPTTAYVEIGDDLTARFGPWTVRTPRANVVDACASGPYRWWRTAGPVRYGLLDRSLSFVTARHGVTLRFRDPVPGLEPSHLVTHPTLTVTVADPARLLRLLGAGGLL